MSVFVDIDEWFSESSWNHREHEQIVTRSEVDYQLRNNYWFKERKAKWVELEVKKRISQIGLSDYFKATYREEYNSEFDCFSLNIYATNFSPFGDRCKYEALVVDHDYSKMPTEDLIFPVLFVVRMRCSFAGTDEEAMMLALEHGPDFFYQS